MSFICLPGAGARGDALAGGGEVHWGTVELQRGGVLLVVATSRRHGLLAHEGARDGLQGALFNL